MDIAGSDPGIDGDGDERPPNPMARVFVAAEFSARVAAIFAHPDADLLLPRQRPSRRELLAAVAGSAV